MKRRSRAGSYEGIIGEVLLGVLPRAVGVARVAVKASVQRYITCWCCGAILDQGTAVVFEGRKNGEEAPLRPVCPACAESCRASLADAARGAGARLFALTWQGEKEVLP